MIYETENEQLDIAGLRVALLRITNTDELYADLISKGEHHEDVKDERIPYWAELWPSAIGLSEHLVKNKLIAPGLSVHDMGCGLGLPGIVAGMQGANVLFSDYLQEAIDFAKQNWKLNCNREAAFKKMDWRNPESNFKCDLLLASDVAYERKAFQYLPEAFKKFILPGGKIIVSEPNRLYAQDFFQSLEFLGFKNNRFEYLIQWKTISHRINVFEIEINT